MENKQALPVLSDTKSAPHKPLNKKTLYRGIKGDKVTSQCTSNTQYFERDRNTCEMKKVKTNEYFHVEESSSGSSSTYNCIHKTVEQRYSEQKLLKNIDRTPLDQAWIDTCLPTIGWDIAFMLDFMVKDPVANLQFGRLQSHLQDFVKLAKFGYKIHVLDNLCNILDFLVENTSMQNMLKNEFTFLLKNMDKPISFNVASDVITYNGSLRKFVNYMGYLLIRLEEDDYFDLVSKALIWHLTAPDSQRDKDSVRLSHTLATATCLCEPAVRMLCVTSMHRFPAFLEIALLLACDNIDNCVKMMEENVLECIFYRFNPYFPTRDLPIFDINPADPEDFNVKLGASSVHMSTTLSLLLVLLKTIKEILDKDLQFCLTLPCPDSYSLRCFAWAYRYECRARDHHHEKITLTIIASSLLHCFGELLTNLAEVLMADILSLSVRTEVPLKKDWTKYVDFNAGQLDVQFKKVLIQLSVNFLRTFPYNRFMVETQHWLLGLMYLLDPGLCKLRIRWSPPLFAELQKTAFQALVFTLPITSPELVKEYGLIRRLMWYIEWYSENPYELSVLYWCLRVLHVAVSQRKSLKRRTILKDLFDTHGIIIIIRLCHSLLDQKSLPVEKCQVIISLCLSLLTSALEINKNINCCVYPEIKWPSSAYTLAMRMLDVVLGSLQKHLILSDRWVISLLNFIWEAIIWNEEYRAKFVANNGVYSILDVVTLTRPPVQCLALALLCDVVRAGDAVGQMVTWRACSAASDVHLNLVRRGATIASLLAAVFRDDCREIRVNINADGVIQNLNCPLMAPGLQDEMKSHPFSQKYKRSPICLPAADLAGSRMSKVYAILHMLSKDLAFKVSLADEAYNLYKNIKLPPQDEAILVLSSHYLTLKLNETWVETKIQCPDLLTQDHNILEEFLQTSHGWAKEIQLMQEDVIKKSKKKDYASECSLYAFLSRVRLNIALDALREVRCMTRSADRFQISHALLHDAVWADQRRAELSKALKAPIVKTYTAPLDVQNIIGQHIKVSSIESTKEQ